MNSVVSKVIGVGCVVVVYALVYGILLFRHEIGTQRAGLQQAVFFSLAAADNKGALEMALAQFDVVRRTRVSARPRLTSVVSWWLPDTTPNAKILEGWAERFFVSCKDVMCDGLSLSNLDFRDVNFTKAQLAGADLRGTDLQAANFSEANLREATLQGANLTDANLRAAILTYADLFETRLSGANFENSDLSDARLEGADLSASI